MKNLLKKIPFLTALGLASALYAGCSEPATSTCSFTQRNGQTIEYACGEGYRCALTQAICITTNCGNGVVDGEEECDDGNLQNGDGCSQDCRREVCGNGILDPIRWDEEAKKYVVGEVCDHGLGEGSEVGSENCSANCMSNLTCGNGIVDPNEACDHGLGMNSPVGTPTCSKDCTSDLTCGNGIVDDGEDCDFKPFTQAEIDDLWRLYGEAQTDDERAPIIKKLTCNTATCRWHRCGDKVKGYITEAADSSKIYKEECDYGGVIDDIEGEGEEALNQRRCNAQTCKLNFCGDWVVGVKEDGTTEACDRGPLGDSSCTTSCTLSYCGDGVINEVAGEACDPNVGVDLSGGGTGNYETKDCNYNCTLSECGDNVTNREAGEECDSGRNGSRECTSLCKKSVCGDGIWNQKAAEACDPGKTVNEQGVEVVSNGLNKCAAGSTETSSAESCDTTVICNYDCTRQQCGDGIVNMVNGAEECDNGAANISVSVMRMRDALDAFCSSLNDAQADLETRYQFMDDKGVKYSFCSQNTSGTWEFSLAEEVQEGNKTQSPENRRAAAEYYYTQIYLGDARYQGECGANCSGIQCGNGIIDVGEVCDGTIDALGGTTSSCSDDCRSTSLCGNGVIDVNAGEVCDPPVNGCQSCTSGLSCGNGTVEVGEQCDTGPGTDNKGFCVITANEKYMDSSWNRILYNDTPNKQLNKTQCESAKGLWVEGETQGLCYELRNCIKESAFTKCLIKSAGYASCDKTEEILSNCYDGLAENDNECTSPEKELVPVCISKSCRLAVCGDGFIHEGVEQCDHGQGTLHSNEDLCSSCNNECAQSGADQQECIDSCRAACQEKLVVSGGTAQDGGTRYCNYNCAVNVCGDGIVNAFAGEICDWGDKNGQLVCPNGTTSCEVCSADCTKMVRLGCGDGVVNTEAGEVCDHRVSKVEGAVCDETEANKVNCKAFADPSECLTYPCEVCESCGAEKVYHAIASAVPVGAGLVTSSNVNFRCSGDAAASNHCDAYTTLSSIEIHAVPVEGYELTSWGLQPESPCTDSAAPGGVSRNLSCTFREGAGKVTLAPVFEKTIYGVTAMLSNSQCGTIEGVCSTNEGGKCSCQANESQTSVTCTGENTDHVSFTVTSRDADETAGRCVFTKWTEGCPEVSYTRDGKPVCSGAVGSGWDLTAVMAHQYLITYASSDQAMGSVSSAVNSGSNVNEGTEITLVASPLATYEFTGWTLSNGYACAVKDAGVSSAMQNPCTLTIDSSKGDLSASAGFQKGIPVIRASAVVVTDGVESAPQLASYSFSCQCRDLNAPDSELQDCEAGDAAGIFRTNFEKHCVISYTADDPNAIYQFSTWSGCTSHTDTTCVIHGIVSADNPVKAMFSKNRHILTFSASGMLAGESLSYECAVLGDGGVPGTRGSCAAMFDLGAAVRVYLDRSRSACISDKAIVLAADRAEGEDLVSSSYTCECVQGRFTSCKDANDVSVEDLSLDVSIQRDRVISSTLSNTSSLTLSSASSGAMKSQLHGTVTGQLVGIFGDGDPTTVFSCSSTNCYPASVDMGSSLRLSALADVGYRFLAWKVGDTYLTESTSEYTVDLENGTIAFSIQADSDITPVFLPVLTAELSPEDSGTMSCSVTNCAAASSGQNCVAAVISDETNLYNGFVQNISCAGNVSENICTLAECSIAVSPTVSVRTGASLNGGYIASSWSDSADLSQIADCTGTTCEFSGLTAPDDVTLASLQATGQLVWAVTTDPPSSSELAAFDYRKVQYICKKNYGGTGNAANCSANGQRYYILFQSYSVANSNWSANDYYLISIPNTANRNVTLTCESGLYRCVTDEADLDLDPNQWFNGTVYDYYNPRLDAAFESLKSRFTNRTGTCNSGAYIQCLQKFSEGVYAQARYTDITKSLQATFAEASGATLSVSWQNTSGSPAHELTMSNGDLVQVAQNASVTASVSGLAEGYALKGWKLNNVSRCGTNLSCTFDMPVQDTSTINPVMEIQSKPLNTNAFPSGSGTFKCATVTGGKCGPTYNNCSSDYTYNSSICVRAIPGDGRDFLLANNADGCPGAGGVWMTETVGGKTVGVCKNIVMSEARVVSALFSEQPQVNFSSNQADCQVSCVSPSECTPATSGTVNVASGGSAAFSVTSECGSSSEYEFRLADNTKTCPVASGAWQLNGSVYQCSLSNITQNKTVHAVFSPKPILTTSAGAGGSLVNCSSPYADITGGTTRYHYGDNASVCAKPNAATHTMNLAVGCPSNNGWVEVSGASGVYQCAVSMKSDLTVSAAFDAIPNPTLTTQFNGGSGNFTCAAYANDACGTFGACNAAYALGSQICVRAAPENGLLEMKAEDVGVGCPGAGGTWSVETVEGTSLAVCSAITLNAPTTVTANYSRKPSVSFSSNVAGCDITPQGQSAQTSGVVLVSFGDDISFTIPGECTGSSDNVAYEYLPGNNTRSCPKAPNNGISWQFDESGYKCDVDDVNENRTVYAVFTAKPILTTQLVGTTGSGDIIDCDNPENPIADANNQETAYRTGTAANVCARAAAGYTLRLTGGCPSVSGWTLEGTGDSAYYKCTVTMNSSYTVRATFDAAAGD